MSVCKRLQASTWCGATHRGRVFHVRADLFLGQHRQVLELLFVGGKDRLAANHVRADCAIFLRLLPVPPVAASNLPVGVGCRVVGSGAQADGRVGAHGRQVEHQQGAARHFLANVADTRHALQLIQRRGAAR